MVRADMPKVVGGYLSEIMQVELTRFLGRKPYERMEEEANHRNGSYPRNFALKGIGEVTVKVPKGSERRVSDPGHSKKANNTKMS